MFFFLILGPAVKAITSKVFFMNICSDYEKAYEIAEVLPQLTERNEVVFFADIVQGANKKILDVGCAEGELVIELARRGHDTTGADISQGFLRQTMQLASDKGLKVKTVHVDVEKTVEPCRGNKYDYIYLNDIIEHFRNPIAALCNVRQLLNDGGALIIHTPNCVTPARVKWYLFHPRSRLNYFDPNVLGDFHLSTYDQMTLEKTLNFTGLKVERMIPTRFTSLGVHRLSKVFRSLPQTVAKLFPHLADTLLFVCSKCEPIDLEKQIRVWQNI
ncbi:MAG: methyltransferase domain-containing protein [Chitinivibrionales bacterium]|nr:methyltransferase domain-containing protein [Chitinivibrionales bacterium]MBD3356776.1 methyltransferase domain-containing protein [Chitinivibrionales bacterium]